ncbi:DUF397 domain-containing protein [Actinoallomurus sp. NPDC052274]
MIRSTSSPPWPPSMRVERTLDVSPAAWRKSSYSGTETNCVEVAVVRGSG